MHEVTSILFFLLTALTGSNASQNHRNGLLALPVLYPRQESLICSAGSMECVGHCCVGKSCCAHGVVACCLAGAVCQVFNQAPLCCVQGINCGTPSGTPTTPVVTPTAPVSASSISASLSSRPPTTTTQVPTNSTTNSGTISQSSISNTGTPTAVPPTSVNGNGKLAQSDKIALGVGIAIGVPSALCALIQMWRWSVGK